MIYLIDYENVHSEGLFGVSLLKENDEVDIFYSRVSDTMTTAQFEQMES